MVGAGGKIIDRQIGLSKRRWQLLCRGCSPAKSPTGESAALLDLVNRNTGCCSSDSSERPLNPLVLLIGEELSAVQQVIKSAPR